MNVEKQFLETIEKYNMIKKGDIRGYPENRLNIFQLSWQRILRSRMLFSDAD